MQYAAPHPNPANSYGETYGAHREFLELDAAAHARLKAHCDEVGIVYSTSVTELILTNSYATAFILIDDTVMTLQHLKFLKN